MPHFGQKTGAYLQRRHYPDGAEGLAAFELAKKEKKRLANARGYLRKKVENAQGVVADASGGSSNSYLSSGRSPDDLEAQAVLAAIDAVHTMWGTTSEAEVARRYAEATRKEAVRQGAAVLKQALHTVIAYPNVGRHQQPFRDSDYSISPESQIDMDKTHPTGFTTGEADHDAAEAASVTTSGDTPNAPIMPPASDFFLDERDSALARTHNYCVHPSARPICAHLIAHRHDLSLTDGTGRFAQHLPIPRCSRAMPVGRQRQRRSRYPLGRHLTRSASSRNHYI
jgi:hypothetical protein